ncbi:hypothetical protein B0I35DRAFT_459219 [Stachybotrys elegans]|uniref:Uncharacterized protein n=1 Tax=Stachybotrys elegans TaxID=80388 RepID=A0A8K0SW85_9HYPO|nr:hypothetical protein B0I35DRAFT_459219 [Stachybotrys elegans]
MQNRVCTSQPPVDPDEDDWDCESASSFGSFTTTHSPLKDTPDADDQPDDEKKDLAAAMAEEQARIRGEWMRFAADISKFRRDLAVARRRAAHNRARIRSVGNDLGFTQPGDEDEDFSDTDFSADEKQDELAGPVTPRRLDGGGVQQQPANGAAVQYRRWFFMALTILAIFFLVDSEACIQNMTKFLESMDITI